MIITGMHWLVATVVAVLVHLAGILWLTIASPEPQPEVASASEGIVVTLGRKALTAAGSRDAPEPETPADTTIAATDEVEPPQPDTTLDAIQPQEPAPEESVAREPAAEPQPAPSAVDSANPETLDARQLDEAASVDPDPARAPAAAPTVAAATAAVEETPARPEPTVSAAETPEAVAVESPQARHRPRQAVPTEPADDAAVPEQSRPPETAREVESVDPGTVSVPETPTVDRPRPEPAGEDVALVEEVETAPAEQGGPRTARQTVEPRTSDDTDIDVAAVRQPTPEAPAASEPEVAESAAPETVKLEELQQRSGGSGVVASYAGVLKGWLQRNMHYPRAARLAGQEGDVVVRFIIDRQGNVQSVALESGSGHSLLDREATEMVERGDPFPAMPDDMPGERLEVRVPVSFEVRDADRTRDLPTIYLE